MSTGGWGSDWPAQTTPKTYEQGIAEGEKRERAAVVAWLLERGYYTAEAYADSIESGAHRREVTK